MVPFQESMGGNLGKRATNYERVHGFVPHQNDWPFLVASLAVLVVFTLKPMNAVGYGWIPVPHASMDSIGRYRIVSPIKILSDRIFRGIPSGPHSP